jgi:hypothetical protein
VKAAGSDARPLPRGATLARMTGVLFQGRGLPRHCAKSAFREGGRGVLDLGDWGVARTPLCVKKRQLGRLMDRYALAGVDTGTQRNKVCGITKVGIRPQVVYDSL